MPAGSFREALLSLIVPAWRNKGMVRGEGSVTVRTLGRKHNLRWRAAVSDPPMDVRIHTVGPRLFVR